MAQQFLVHDALLVDVGCEHLNCWSRSWWQTSAAQKSWRISSEALKKTRHGWACARTVRLGLFPTLAAEQAHCLTHVSQVSHSPRNSFRMCSVRVISF